MDQKSVWVRWYPRLIALLFAAIFVFVVTKYVSQLRSAGGNLPKTHFSAEENEILMSATLVIRSGLMS